MNSKEKLFVDSIKKKIKDYAIPTTLKEVLEYYTDTFIETSYNDGTTELVDMGVEYRLCQLSAYYFIKRYAYIEIPGVGTLPFSLYYFQEETLKKLPILKKTVFNKTRQCGISTLTSVYCFWKGNFHDSESIDVISTKQTKAQAYVAKMDATYKNLPLFLRTPVKNKNMHGIKWENGSQVISETASETAGRGDSLSLLILDEAAHYQSDRLTRGIVGAAMPTLSRTGGSLVVISTPNRTFGSGAYYYEQVNSLSMKGNGDTERLVEIDWWEIPDIKGIKPYRGFNEKLNEFIEKDYFNNPVVKEAAKRYFQPIEENWRENDFLSKQHEDLGNVLFKQEIFHDFIVGEDQVFDEAVLEDLKEKIRNYKPLYEDELNGNKLNGLLVWNLPKPKTRYVLGCLPPGEKVLTQDGLKNIEDVDTANDMLYDKKGNLTKIKNKQIYDANENIYKIKIEGILRESSFTGEHPIISSKNKITRKHGEPRKLDLNFNFSKVEDLESGDWLKFPNFYRNKELTEKEILLKWNESKSGRYDFDLKEEIILNEEFWWFVGMWLADGWIQNNNYSKSIHTCHNYKTESFYADRVKNLFLAYDRKVGYVIKEENNVINTYFSSSQLHSFLENNFGKYAYGKNIPEWVKFLPERYKIKLLEGYYNGDGSLVNGKSISFVSVSQKLMEDIQDILFSVGVVSSLSLLRKEGTHIFPSGRQSKTKKTFQLHCGRWDTIKFYQLLGKNYLDTPKSRKHLNNNHFSDDLKYIYLKIKKITSESYKGEVYNFETEDHTYLCNYLTTHNCDVSTGTGKDYSTIQVMDVDSYEQVAEYKGKTSTKRLGKIVKILAKYYNEGFVAIESNSIGEAVFNEVYYHDTDPYDNVYKQKKTKNGVSRFTGWETSSKSRQLMTNDLIDWFNVDDLRNQLKIKSFRLYQELTTWVWKNGRPDHLDNSHDDSIIAFGLCLHLRNKVTDYGDSFFIGDDGTLFQFEESDKNRDINDGFGFETTEEFQKDAEDLIEERYGMDMDSYKWLIG